MKTFKQLQEELNEMFWRGPSKEHLKSLADPNSWAASLSHSKPEWIRRKKAVDDELETSNRDQIYSALTHRSIGMNPDQATDLISDHEDDTEAFQKLLRIVGKSKHPNAATARAWANKLDRQKAKGIKVFGS